ncbi:uncharacterized protein N7503_000457 [Penicillium pulvis]|uniref:uncharacterized protein n=1 Tax=Penicillium pulvis TaxID=1562058 RepID=UPI0025492B1F|nr:uncharacterized protein N7503_000457 [Penicillium pulvis]KAJ5813707.1 hypothetical protein N7503_000457 [Penicillium pulvis]
MDLLKVKAMFEHPVTGLSKCSLERIISDIRHLPITVFLNSFIPAPRDIERAQTPRISSRFGSSNV